MHVCCRTAAQEDPEAAEQEAEPVQGLGFRVSEHEQEGW